MRRTRVLARLAAAAALALMLGVAPAHAQIVRNFTPRFSANNNGDVSMIGNTPMSCSGGGQAANGRKGNGGIIEETVMHMT
jgi:hypothetical protein